MASPRSPLQISREYFKSSLVGEVLISFVLSWVFQLEDLSSTDLLYVSALGQSSKTPHVPPSAAAFKGNSRNWILYSRSLQLFNGVAQKAIYRIGSEQNIFFNSLSKEEISGNIPAVNKTRISFLFHNLLLKTMSSSSSQPHSISELLLLFVRHGMKKRTVLLVSNLFKLKPLWWELYRTWSDIVVGAFNKPIQYVLFSEYIYHDQMDIFSRLINLLFWLFYAGLFPLIFNMILI